MLMCYAYVSSTAGYFKATIVKTDKATYSRPRRTHVNTRRTVHYKTSIVISTTPPPRCEAGRLRDLFSKYINMQTAYCECKTLNLATPSRTPSITLSIKLRNIESELLNTLSFLNMSERDVRGGDGFDLKPTETEHCNGVPNLQY